MTGNFIVLEGIDASGKSTLGSLLAERLGYVFMELNQDELRQGIAEMWPHLDQSAIHLLNLTSLKHTSNRIRGLLAQGTGVVCARYRNTVEVYNEEVNLYEGNRDIIRPDVDALRLVDPDVTIYLDVAEPVRKARMGQRGKVRPSDYLMEIDVLRGRIKQELRDRADLTFDTTHHTPDQLVDEIATALTHRLITGMEVEQLGM